MKLTKNKKNELLKYNINVPIDGRTTAFKNEIKKYGSIKLYRTYINGLIKQAKLEEKQKIRYIGTIFVKYEITEQRDIIGGIRGEVSLLPREKINNNRYNYYIRITLRFDITIKKELLNDYIISLIEEKKINILSSDAYISNVETIEYKSDYQEYKEGITTANIKMKDAYSYIIDGFDNQEWNTKTGRCVFDYLIYTYGKIKGFIKLCNYEKLNELFKISQEEDCLISGVNTLQIEQFCRLNGISMYAFDDTQKLFKIYTPLNRNKHAPCLMFKVCNNHFYPIPQHLRNSYIRQITNTSSGMINYKKIKEETKETIIKLFNNEPFEELGNYINENKIIPKKIKMIDRNITSFSSKNIKYIFDENTELIKNIIYNMNIEYTSQSISNILQLIIKETIEELPKSTHNPFVFNSLCIAKKNRVFTGLIDEEYKHLLNHKSTIARDISKCYTSILYKPIEEWILLDFNDEWKIYKEGDKIELGLYYIETNDTLLFKKNDIYSSSIINKAIEEDIHFTIKYKLISKNKQYKTLFKPIIKKIIEYSKGDNNIYKLIINALSGLLGRHKSIISECFINKDIDQIFNSFNNFEKTNKQAFINKIPNTDYYLYGTDNIIYNNETNLPMYIQILDQSNIKVYDLMKEMIKTGGKLIARKIDCVVVYNGNNNILNSNKWGFSRNCNIPNIDFKEKFIDKEYNFINEWIDYNINDSDNWEDIHNIVINKNGLLLQSQPGFGKTYTAKKIKEKLENVVCLAPTNKASLNIGGITIHRFLKLDENNNISKTVLNDISKKYKYIIIDEISMITKKLWQLLILVKQMTNITFILLGDDKQLPPVEDENIDDYFNHSAIKYLVNNNRNILTIKKRYDDELLSLLKNVDNLDTNLFNKINNRRSICYLNITRKQVNKLWNEKEKQDNSLFIKADINDDYTQDTYIYKGLPIIARKTINKGDICINNETFEVIDYDNDNIYLFNERCNEDGIIEPHNITIKINEFIKNFSLNYCSTTHKVQGETITEDITIYDWNKMSTKCKYTALSRVKNINQVSFTDF